MVRIFKFGCRDPWNVKLVRIFKFGCRDPLTAKSARILKLRCRDPWTVKLFRIFKFGCREFMDHRIGPYFKIWFRGSMDTSLVSGTHGHICCSVDPAYTSLKIFRSYYPNTVVRKVVDSILPHAKSGPNDHRKGAPPFSV